MTFLSCCVECTTGSPNPLSSLFGPIAGLFLADLGGLLWFPDQPYPCLLQVDCKDVLCILCIFCPVPERVWWLANAICGTPGLICKPCRYTSFVKTTRLITLLLNFQGPVSFWSKICFKPKPMCEAPQHLLQFTCSFIHCHEDYDWWHTLPGTQKRSQSAGLSLNLANSEYQCLPTGVRSSSRGPNGNNFTIGQNIGILFGILIGLRFFTFALLQAAYKLKRLWTMKEP